MHGAVPHIAWRGARFENDATVLLAMWERGQADEETTVRALAALLPS